MADRIGRLRRARRIRYKLREQRNDRPRLSVFRSGKHIYAQVIDDRQGRTLAQASTLDKELAASLEKTSNKDAAAKVGELVARRALEQGLNEVVFDRGGYIYHGRVKALADGAGDAGLQF